MGWPELQARQQAAVFAALGEDAHWNGDAEPVRVVLRDQDSLIGMTVVDAISLHVRQVDVDQPEEGDTIELAADGRRFGVIGTPLLDRKRNWRCEAAPLGVS